jgi:YidC/Oxa1 family membrane protein insertase
MNTQERVIVGLLVAALIGWMFFYPRLAPKPVQQPAAPAAAVTNSVMSGVPTELKTPDSPTAPDVAPPAPQLPEERVSVSNDAVRITVSSWGGGVVMAELLKFGQSTEDRKSRYRLDFSEYPALSLTQLPGLETHNDFLVSASGRTVRIEGRATNGIGLTRTLTLQDDYRIAVVDVFTNPTDENIKIPSYGMRLGRMEMVQSRYNVQDSTVFGVDTLAMHGGNKVQYWGSAIPGYFGAGSSMFSCGKPTGSPNAPASVTHQMGVPLEWAAVKNKFFVQILEPEGGCSDGEIFATRNMKTPEAFALTGVGATVRLGQRMIAAGGSATQNSTCYIGPKKYSLLRSFPKNQADVMEFGFFRPVCILLLHTLNGIYWVLPSYGIAIILLTGLVRLVFWPVTHKGNQSMKEMQKLKPLMDELRLKYKDNAQKLNQETMLLYREHKVSPFSGCLPMLVQIPVFFALYVMLRSAVELRLDRFLWIRDLSEPETLFEGMIPLIGSLNILPLLMTATMIWQQKLTPSMTDPQQQKMMMIMSAVMMFMFYSMPAGLLLYWTVSQCLAIVQLIMQQRKAT